MKINRVFRQWCCSLRNGKDIIMKIKDGRIVPGKSIGIYRLGIKKSELLQLLSNEFKTNGGKYGDEIISIENARFWLNKDDVLYQIGVSKGFEGGYDNIIKIGATLKIIQEKYGGYEEIHDTYSIRGIGGMCFELEDVEEWSEETAPIEWIYVYKC